MSRDFWGTISDFCTELAPVSGPLLSVIGETAAAIDRASNPPQRSLRSAAVHESRKAIKASSTSKRRRSSKPKAAVTTEVDYV